MRNRIGISRIAWSALFGMLWASGALSAEEVRVPMIPSTPTPLEKDSWIKRVDRFHEAACSYVLDLSEGMDGLLSGDFRKARRREDAAPPSLVYDREHMANSRGTRIVLSPTLLYRSRDGTEVGTRISGRLQLPRLSKRLDLIFDSDYDESDLTPELSKDRRVGLRAGESGTARLRYRLSNRFTIKPDAEVGLRFKPEPVPRLGLKLRVSNTNHYFNTRITQKFYWQTDDGWGERTSLDFSRAFRPGYLVRFNASLLWTEASEGVQGGETLQLYRFLSRRRAVGVKLGVFGPLEPSAFVDTYSARLSWRQRLHRDWLFLQIEPGIDWPRSHNYESTPFVQISMDIVLGDWIERDLNGSTSDR